MIKVEFKSWVNGVKKVLCKDISSDPMNGNIFLIRFSIDIVWEVDYRLIKHISPCK